MANYPRLLAKTRQTPRVWPQLVDTQQGLLTDAAWIVRKVRSAGAVDGTPNFTPTTYGGPGGYAAKLSTPDASEVKAADRMTVETSYTLAIMCDVVPVISDFVTVLAPEILNNEQPVQFRVTGDVQSRRTTFGAVLLWHMNAQIYIED